MKIIVARAFTQGGQGGNKAGVCLAAENLTAAEMQAIAKEMGYSETVFISAADVAVAATFRLAYFTPAEEVPLCGHATIAAFVVMHKLLPLVKNHYGIQTKSGLLSVELTGDSEETLKVFMEQNKPVFGEKPAAADFNDCFAGATLRADLPIQVVSTGLRDILLPIQDAAQLQAMRPDFEAITKVSEKYDTVGIHAFALEKGRIICRNFAPRYDIPEESATGTSNGALACYLYAHGIVKETDYAFEQGYALNEPSRIDVKLTAAGGKIDKVVVGGSGCICGDRIIDLPQLMERKGC